MQASQMTLAELGAIDTFGSAQLQEGRMVLSLTNGEARQYEWSDGHPDSLVTSDESGTHYLLRECVGAGACHFVPVESRSEDPAIRVHAIVTPDEKVIGTLVTRLVTPNDTPRSIIDRARRVADKVAGWLINEQPTPELHLRVRPAPSWNEA